MSGQHTHDGDGVFGGDDDLRSGQITDFDQVRAGVNGDASAEPSARADGLFADAEHSAPDDDAETPEMLVGDALDALGEERRD